MRRLTIAAACRWRKAAKAALGNPETLQLVADAGYSNGEQAEPCEAQGVVRHGPGSWRRQPSRRWRAVRPQPVPLRREYRHLLGATPARGLDGELSTRTATL